MSRFSLVLLAAGLTLLVGCNESASPPAPAPVGASAALSIPAYPTGFVDISNTVWESCLFDSVDNHYLRRRWNFFVNDASVSQFRHEATDSSCSGTSTRDWYYDFEAITDDGSSSATGWVNAFGTAVVGGGAPVSLGGLGNLPAQPLARRSKFKLQRIYFGRPPYPYSTSILDAPTKLLLFVDASGSPSRLYVGGVSSTLDFDGYPVFLESETGLMQQ